MGVSPRNRTNRTLLRSALLAAVLLVLLSGCAGLPALRPAAGRPGAAGPCGTQALHLVNPADVSHELTVVLPTGGASPWTGGVCDGGGRPLVLFAHGYTASAVGAYQGLVDHMVSNGFAVVFPGYTNQFDPAHQYGVVDVGFQTAVEQLGRRVDTSRVGVVGHSFGGGMAPWLLQRVAARGWGSAALWSVAFAPWYSFQVGAGAISMPARTRLAVVSYEDDRIVDARIGIEALGAAQLPESQRRHITVRSDFSQSPPMIADHYGPVSLGAPLAGFETDHMDRWSAFPTVDATARCSLDGTWCDADLSDLGTWPDGTAVRPAVVSSHGVDSGPRASQECDSPLNPRSCP